MSGHYPFSGKANRVSVFAFFEKHNFSLALQEQYYKWWYDWAKAFVMNDADLKVTKAYMFAEYPAGQHAHDNFHLHDYAWSNLLLELGEFVKNTILPKLNDAQTQQLEKDHHDLIERLRAQRETQPREAPPAVGRYRHT